MSPELIGYADKLSVMPDERIRFMVSTDQPAYEVTIVRLIHADENPAGPDFKEIPVDADVNQSYPGRRQTHTTGSYVLVPDHPALRLDSLTLQAWIYPSTPAKTDAQGLLTKWSPRADSGYGLYIGSDGALEFRLGDGTGQVERVSSGRPLRANEWYFVAAAFNADTHQVTLVQQPVKPIPHDPSAAIVKSTVRANAPAANDAPLLMAAAYTEPITEKRSAVRGCYNGKIEHPAIFSRALTWEELERLRQDADPTSITRRDLIAAWNFAENPSSNRVTDTARHRLHGTAVNMPERAVIGHTWSGTEFDFKHAPDEYGAIYFHDDDLEDAGWEPDFEWHIPPVLKSGVYAARLRTANGQEDHIPFYVRPPRGTATAPAAFLVPTMTYLAYANQRIQTDEKHNTGVTDRPIVPGLLDIYAIEHPEIGLSIYDRHSDNSGVLFSSRLRPIVTLRPKYRYWLTNAPRHLAADLYLIDWLEAKGIPYDVITDEDLHFEGKELLSSYRVVMTGSHPEYWTTPMIEGLEGYLAYGGRLMYLGGNGFYWVTGVDPERPHIIEVRRGIAGSRDWSSHPGELYLSTTGELGGLWRHRGKGPNQWVGIGFTGMGWDGRAGYFVRKPASKDPRAAFIFEGIDDDEKIGDFGLVLGGAAGDELDRADYALGTPAHTLVVASSTGHSRYVLPVIEDFGQINAELINNLPRTVYADMVYFETPNNGAVFSTGSITWIGSLSHNNYDNNVSRITENVLRRFIED